jgi:dipeptidyl aminopeptidase/acylaminoacyl peptidase
MLPVLILHGEQDTVIPPSEARKLALLLDTLKVPHQVELFAGETHWFSARSQPKLLLTCAGFLQQHLRF